MATYHPGELAVQQRAGVTSRASKVGNIINGEIPPIAARFLADRPFVIIGGLDRRGLVHATALFGEPGFASSATPGRVVLSRTPGPGDPLEQLAVGDEIGMLAIDFATRRRMRVNGTLAATAGRWEIAVDQAYSNCPKYITPRPAPEHQFRTSAPVAGWTDVLSPSTRDLIRRSDTFFLATIAQGHGADVSHRGGPPGFVELAGDVLTWPDYAGNSMFNSLGNIEVDPRAGLLFIDFRSGAVVHLAGRARINWDMEEARSRPGAERLVEFRLERVMER